MFGFIKEKLKKIYSQVGSKLSTLFSREKVDDDFLEELNALLISADTGIETTKTIIEHLKSKNLQNTHELKLELSNKLLSILNEKVAPKSAAPIIMLVGINGSGKTTFAGKLANKLKESNKKVLCVAADTFRAAAVQQLDEWGKRIGIDVFMGNSGDDPSSVIFDGCKAFISGNYDHIIIDTAGRVQTKVNLMKELTKMRSTIKKVLPDTETQTLLTIDAMLGQNSFEQAKIFNEATSVDGIVLTKLDGTGKGGILFSIAHELHLPVIYVTFGEEVTALKQFDPDEYVRDLLGE